MGLCGKLFTFKTIVLLTAIIFGYYREEILNFARENYDLCPQNVTIIEKEVSTSEINEKPKLQDENKFNRPKYWLIGKNIDDKFNLVRKVLDRVGLEQFNGTLSNEESHKGWNLVWSDKANIPLNWRYIDFHQKFNHFPFSKYLSSPSYFGTHTNSKYVPKTFTNDTSLSEFVKKNPKKRFLKKSKVKKGKIVLTKVKNLKFTDDDDFYVQEYVENPLLFDNRKFDFSIYVLMTSVDPLRLYYFAHNLNIRFTNEKYSSSDENGVGSYIIGDAHENGLEFVGIRDIFLNGGTFREGLDWFVKREGGDVEKMWTDIEDCIRSVVLSKEKDFINYFDTIKEDKYPYFELFSFDFMLDANFNLHLLNINSDPDLSAQGAYQRNHPMYENLLYNTFLMLGIATPYQQQKFVFETAEMEMTVMPANTRTVSVDFCTYDCEGTCNGRCALCLRCMQRNQFYETVLSYQEQMNLGGFRRLFPPEKEFLASIDEKWKEELADKSQFQLEWFIEMCKKNRYFF